MSAKRKPVINETNGDIYQSLHEAAWALGVSAPAIHQAIVMGCEANGCTLNYYDTSYTHFEEIQKYRAQIKTLKEIIRGLCETI